MPGFNIPIQDRCGGQIAGSGPPVVVETARRHRYVLETLEPFGSKDTGILLYAYKCTRPVIEVDQVAIHNAQDDISRPGKQHWKPVEMTFYEVTTGGEPDMDQVAGLVHQWWAKTMINVETSLHNPPDDYLKNCQLDMLNGAGKPLWTYLLYDCWPATMTPSNLDYSDTAIAETTVTLAYAKAREKYPGQK